MAIYCGQGNASGNQDGVVSSARLHSPHGLVNMGSSLIVCDTGNRSVRVISNGKPFKELSAVIYPHAQLFNLDHYRGIPRKSFTESFAIVDKLVEFLITWGMQTKERTGRVSTRGPDHIIPYCTRNSFLMMHETLVKPENLSNELGASDLLSQVRLTAMVTLRVENFFSLMRKDDPMPTQFEYGARRATCVRELQTRKYRGSRPLLHGPKRLLP